MVSRPDKVDGYSPRPEGSKEKKREKRMRENASAGFGIDQSERGFTVDEAGNELFCRLDRVGTLEERRAGCPLKMQETT